MRPRGQGRPRGLHLCVMLPELAFLSSLHFNCMLITLLQSLKEKNILAVFVFILFSFSFFIQISYEAFKSHFSFRSLESLLLDWGESSQSTYSKS